MAQLNTVYFGNHVVDQAADLTFYGDVEPTGGRIDLDEQLLDAVLSRASPLEMIDHGIGPFVDNTTHFQPSGFGVISIANIPYNVTKSEIIHFLGRNASLIAQSEHGCSIHIIMERPTSKTMDCFVELLTKEAAVDAFQKHDNLVMSGKHPRIGTRHVDVTVSSQDELLRAIFPRARGLVWECGVPRKVENHDPYSAGFQGFFTREEIIGMYRHAETPQRSPFSVKCLQRTFECMISTLYKFPWHAQHMYTLEDRAQLFSCYMKQLDILTSKVAESQTVGLDMKLLIDFVTAGLNCAGFGERMRYMIAAHSGQVGANFPIDKKSAAWPFDVLGVPYMAPDGHRWWFEHRDTLDLLMYLIELGHGVCGNNYAHSEWIKVLPPSPPSDFDHENVTSVRFKFMEEVLDVSYDELVSRETELMRQMLQVGFAKWAGDMQSSWEEGKFSQDMQRDVDCLANLQQFDQIYGAIGRLSLSASPKGTVTGEDKGQITSQKARYGVPTRRSDLRGEASVVAHPSKGIDPTVDPFQPSARRNSEPSFLSPNVGVVAPVRSESSRELAVCDTMPHARQSAAVDVRHPDDATFSPSGSKSASQSPVGTVSSHRSSNVKSSSPRMRHNRGAFSVGQTIQEEMEDDGNEEVIMMAGRPRRSTNAAF